MNPIYLFAFLFISTSNIYAQRFSDYCTDSKKKAEFVCFPFKEMQQTFEPNVYGLERKSFSQWQTDPSQENYEKSKNFLFNMEPFKVDLYQAKYIISDRLDQFKFLANQRRKKNLYFADYRGLIYKALYTVFHYECARDFPLDSERIALKALLKLSQEAYTKNPIQIYDDGLFSYVMLLMSMRPYMDRIDFLLAMNDSFHQLFSLQVNSSRFVTNALQSFFLNLDSFEDAEKLRRIDLFLFQHFQNLDFKFVHYYKKNYTILSDHFKDARETANLAELIFEKKGMESHAKFYEFIGKLISQYSKGENLKQFNSINDSTFANLVRQARATMF